MIKSGEKIQDEGKILSNSPFFALVVKNHSEKIEEKIYISKDQFPSDLVSHPIQDESIVDPLDQKQPSLNVKNKNTVESQPDQFEEKRKILIELSQKHFPKSFFLGIFNLKPLNFLRGGDLLFFLFNLLIKIHIGRLFKEE